MRQRAAEIKELKRMMLLDKPGRRLSPITVASVCLLASTVMVTAAIIHVVRHSPAPSAPVKIREYHWSGDRLLHHWECPKGYYVYWPEPETEAMTREMPPACIDGATATQLDEEETGKP